MRFIDRSVLDRSRWDELVARSGGDIFSYSWYLDACAESWCVLADDDMENGIALGFSVRLGVQAVSPPIFTRNLDFMGEDIEFRAKAMKAIRDRFPAGHLQLKEPASSGMEVSERIFQQAGVAERQLNQQAGRMLRKAARAGLSIRKTTDSHEILDVIARELPGKVSELRPENLERLRQLTASLEKAGKLVSYAIYRNGVLEGGMLYMDTAGKRIYLKGAAIRAARDAGGMYLCMEEAIQDALSGNKTFDFGGSGVEGVRRFNHNLGGTDQPYYIYTWNRTPWWFRLIKKTYQRWKKK